jgi:mono/diheme cytochrome c family protein
MKRSTVVIFAGALVLLGVGYVATAEGRAEAGAPRAVMGPYVGDLVLDVQFRDVEKNRGRLSELRQAGAVVAVTWNSECPASQQYVETMKRLETELAGRGVSVVYLNLGGPGSIKEMKADAAAQGLRGQYVRDPEWKVARLLQPTAVPEAFVMDAGGTLRYRGAIDDQFEPGLARAAPGGNFLLDAVNDVLAGREVAVPVTAAAGCEVAAPAGATPAELPLGWHNRSSRVVQANCQSCHRPGGEAASPLTSLAEFQALAPAIRAMLRADAASPVAHPAGAIPGDALSERDVADLRLWMDAGMPEGRRRDAPAPRRW